MNKIIKPSPRSRSQVLYWNEIAEYIKKKYKRDVCDWLMKFHGNKKDYDQIEYQNFWHHLVDEHEINNGTVIFICPAEAMMDSDMPEWQKEIYKILQDEFGEGFEVLCAW